MPRPSADAERLAERHRLALFEVPRRGLAGELLGRGTGSSLEFQDRRNYAPGDDIRHLDWRAMARSDQALVRVYREELLPRLELVLDLSRSMASDPEKAARALDLAYVLARSAELASSEVRITLCGERPERIALERLHARETEFEARAPLGIALAEAASLFTPGGLRVVISDFLAPFDARELVRPLAARSGGLVLLQVLSGFDRAPAVGTALRLVDAESDESLDAWLDEATVDGYRRRLKHLIDGLEVETRRANGRFFSLDASEPLALQVDRDLIPAGVLAAN
ncbi:MAG: DUF58 domain-containing protein [Planctomycetes bacterium]|nr:DUF58 domain-containing protein [Planctomycetota bacterium]